MKRTALYFGLSYPNGTVIDPAEWQGFLDSQVSPRFRKGFSVFDAKGQWLTQKNVVDRESSKELVVVYAPNMFTEYSIETW
ncbi:hypothetical protein AAVH_06694 [Aphelenchoides avenae]|nr:hypothetical protein AAVH_06694 [Aphelenchus avenae]